MTFRRALKLFARRMLLSRLANWCPFVSMRLAIYRLMGMTIGRDVYIGFDVEFDTNYTELIQIGDGVTIGREALVAREPSSPATSRREPWWPESPRSQSRAFHSQIRRMAAGEPFARQLRVRLGT